MKVTSGAHIYKVGGRVIKVGTGEVGKRASAQAHYSQRFDPAAFPVIHQIFPRGYVMERLDEYTQGTRYIYDVTHILQSFVWVRPSNCKPDWHAHLAYIMGKTKKAAPGYASRVADLFYTLRLESEELWRSQVHGDPTYDNMMMRGSQPILIDPLPPYPNGEMPELASVDVGKIMQSLLGYEAIKYGTSIYDGIDVTKHFTELQVLLELEDAEWKAAHWFLVCHIVRLIPYQPMNKREACIDLLCQALCRAEALTHT